jgi:hypothetical protein
MEATRRGTVAVHMMPSQLQKWVLSFHEAKACCGSRVMDFFKSSSDSRSVSVSVSFPEAEEVVMVLQDITNSRKCPTAVAFMAIISS